MIDDSSIPEDNEPVQNPFGKNTLPSSLTENAAAQAAVAREVSDMQTAMVIAKKFPRDPIAAMDRILNAFTRPTLAAVAQYQYARAGTDIRGPSIRAAEAIAQEWGNLHFGLEELDQRTGHSTVRAFAWDLETNVRRQVTFQVKHWRDTKAGGYAIHDSRDVYELVANLGQRRVRACILDIVPGDVVDRAMEQVAVTMTTTMKITPERLAEVLAKFEASGVSKEQLEAKIQRHWAAVLPAQMVMLRGIMNSMRDGLSTAADWFEPIQNGASEAQTPATEDPPKKGTAALLDRIQTTKRASPQGQRQVIAMTAAEITKAIEEAHDLDALALAQSVIDGAIADLQVRKELHDLVRVRMLKLREKEDGAQ